MNKKEYLEAQRELREERKEERDKLLDAAGIAIHTVCLAIIYALLFFFKEVFLLLSPETFWLIGAYTVIVLYVTINYFEERKKEVKHGRRKKES